MQYDQTWSTYTKYIAQLSDDEQSIAETSSDDENTALNQTTQNNLLHLFPIKLKIKLSNYANIIKL